MIPQMEMLDTKRYNAPSFTRITYHTTEGREFWAPLIAAASRSVQVMEMASVAEGRHAAHSEHQRRPYLCSVVRAWLEVATSCEGRTLGWVLPPSSPASGKGQPELHLVLGHGAG